MSCGSGCGYCGRCQTVGRPDACCADCGAGIMFGRFDVEPICDECFQTRSRWVDAKEATHQARRMLKLPLQPRQHRTDVA